MPNPVQYGRRLEIAALLLALLGVAASLLLAHMRGSWSVVAGDESTFLAMTESLALDGDLEFTASDRERLDASESKAYKSVILQRAGGRIAYSKPVVYPLVAAPAYRLFGRPGMVGLNALALAGALLLFRRRARRQGTRGEWALTLATFAATGAVVAQLAWVTSDALQLALALGGGTLAMRAGAGRSAWASALGSGALLGLLISMRLPNAIVVVAVVVAVAVSGRIERSVWVAAGAVSGFALATLLNLALAGAANPYRAERATFNAATGYPAGAGADEALDQFVAGRATQRLGAVPRVRPRVTAYAGLYYLVGRHTGLLAYFPVALVLFGAALRGGGRARLTLLAGVAASVGFYLVWMPENYFGGAAFVGNRYFLPAYGLLLPALRKPPRLGLLIGVWALSGSLFYSAFESVSRERDLPYSSQSHAHAGAFRLLPYESTALAIETREDRYFSDEFLRFTDRNASSHAHGFHLTSGLAPAEILLATPRPSGILRFLALADRPEATLVYRDWRGTRRIELEPDPSGARGLIELVAAPAWRRHPFWFTHEPWRAHAIRLSLEAGGEPGGRADLRYLGPYRLAAKFFAYAARELSLPARGVAGRREPLTVRLVNRGLRPWASDADIPIHLMHQIASESGDPIATGFTELVDRVEPGAEVRVEVDLVWPSEPGRYWLYLDLTAGGVAPFQDWLGDKLGTAYVEVVSPEATAAAVVSCLECDRAVPPPVWDAFSTSSR